MAQYWRDFQFGYSDGNTPSDFSSIWNSTASNWTVNSSADTLDVAPNGEYSALGLDEADYSGTQEVVAKFENVNGGYDRVVLKADGGQSSKNGIVALWAPDDPVRIWEYSNDSITSHTTYKTFPSGPYWIRLRYDGSNIYAKAWGDSGSEPSSWDLNVSADYNHSGVNAGGHVHLSASNTASYDIIAYGTNGDSAPLTAGAPSSPQNLTSSISNDNVVLNWDATSDWNGDYGEYEIHRGTSSGSTSLYATVEDGTTSYTDTNISQGTTYYYVIRASNAAGTSLASNETSELLVDAPSSPQNVSATVDANDQISVAWDAPSSWGGERGHYDVQMWRDGTGYNTPGGGTSPVSDDGSSSYSVAIGPSSDSAYERQVGIDSWMYFEVRAENSAGTSSWQNSGAARTDPLPPHNPSVNRPDGSTFEINFTVQSDVADRVVVHYKEDTGSGYGSWSWFDTVAGSESQNIGGEPGTKGDNVTIQYNVGQSYQAGVSLQSDARYQFRLRQDYQGSRSSEWVYPDYGNQGNVFFEDDFESGDLSAWGTTNLSDADSGIQSGSYNRLGISGADQGTYYCRLDAGDDIRVSVGSISSDTDIFVRVVSATGSMDSSGEQAYIEWYDGSSYQQLETLGWEYNKQGWVQGTYIVPSSYIDGNSSNVLRLRGYGGGGDHFAVDNVIISDNLHEYTTPAAPSGLSTSATTEGEIAGSWTNNHSFSKVENVADLQLDGNWQNANVGSFSSHTFTGLKDGEQYTYRIWTQVQQDRRGTGGNNTWNTSIITTDQVTVLPAPTSLSVPNIGPTSADFTWTNNHDYGSVTVQYRKSSDSAWQDSATGLSRNTESDSLSGLLNGEEYDVRILAVTEHTQTEDS